MQAQVVRVIDGDTIDVEIEGEVYCVRQLGVDCPEADCEFGQLATDVNRALVEGKRVELEKDMPDTDEHGRLLRYVFVGGMMVNAKLLRLGYASAVTVHPDVAHGEEFLALEREAQLSGVGLCLLRDSPLPTGSALAAQDMAQ